MSDSMLEKHIRFLASKSKLHVDNKKRQFIYDGEVLSVNFSTYPFADLDMYNGLDVEQELFMAVLEEIAEVCNLTPFEKKMARYALIFEFKPREWI